MSKNTDSLQDILDKDLVFHPNLDLRKYSTFHLKARGDLVVIKSEAKALVFLQWALASKVDFRILGMGSNQLLRLDPPFLYLKLDLPFDRKQLQGDETEFYLPASLPLGWASAFAQLHQLRHWEVFTGIPGTIGGAVVMNAGTSLGEISSILRSVRIARYGGGIEELEVTASSFRYRGNNFCGAKDLILGACFKNLGHDENTKSKIISYLNYRRKTQPTGAWTCGCTFKNHRQVMADIEKVYPAGKFIDLLGLKGFSMGDLSISKVHGNFFENTGEATYEEMVRFVQVVRSILLLNYGIEFPLEIIL